MVAQMKTQLSWQACHRAIDAIGARSWAIALVFVLTTTAVGCGDPHGRQPVSGRISLNGAPVDLGDISFTPLEGGAFGGGAMFVNGNYEIPKAEGLPPGKYLVRISSSAVEQKGAVELGFAAPPGAVTARELIPTEYNTKSDKTVEVTSSGPNQFNFDIVKK